MINLSFPVEQEFLKMLSIREIVLEEHFRLNKPQNRAGRKIVHKSVFNNATIKGFKNVYVLSFCASII